MDSNTNEIGEYIAHGWKLVSIPPGKKGPLNEGWNREENCITDTNVLPDSSGIGLAHAYSGTMALDVDDWDQAVAYLAERGVDLQVLCESPNSVMIESGNPGHKKLLYHCPPFLALPTKRVTQDASTILEFRCGTADGLTMQDVLPPSIHPKTKQPYQWAGNGDWKKLPSIPMELLTLWQSLATQDRDRIIAVPGEASASWGDIQGALSVIPADCSREEWIRIGMALHVAGSACGDTERALAIWNEWSRGSVTMYPGGRKLQKQWHSFKPDKSNPVTLGTLFHIAREHGWSRPPVDVSGLFPQTGGIRSRQPTGNIYKDFLYVEELNKYYRIHDGAVLLPEAFNRCFHNQFKNGEDEYITAVSKFHSSTERRMVAALGWTPSDTAIFEYANKSFGNTYRGMQVQPIEGDVSLWLRLVNHIYGQYAHLFLDHLAFTVQKPETKIRWQILVIGRPRTGKSLTVFILKKIFAGSCNVITPELINTGWGDAWAQAKVVVVEEVWQPGNKKFFNDIKGRLANDDVECLNIKTKGIVTQQNRASMYLFSNESDALHFDESEDKLLVIRASDERWPEQDYETLAKYLESEQGAGAVLHYLLNRDVTKFSYARLPVRTDALKVMCQHSKADYQKELRELIESQSWPFNQPFFLLNEVKRVLKENGYLKFGDKGISEELESSGYVSVRGQKMVDGRSKKTKTYWTQKDSEFDKAGPAERYDMDCARPTSSKSKFSFVSV